MKSRSLDVLLCLALAAPLAHAQEGPRARGQGWSSFSSQTVGANATVLGGEVGFPGLTLNVLRGLQDNIDIGGRFSLVYAYENMPRLIFPGLKADVLGRVRLLDTDRFGLGINLGVGFLATFGAGATYFGISMPIGLVLGIPISAALMANIGLDMPLFVIFGYSGGLTVPILAGVGFEYFIDKSLAVTLNMRMGSALNVRGPWFGNELAFRMLLGVALKL